ncbi:hypothetical protein [Porphyromonas levii]|uniref:hypothetical protein n=1 Tax=Porphyromonas levii TaxID=28114 RepID=UPI001B8B5B99|nr:hypothetical protein [Porphyromonas levii]MBR8763822.1 hypothetical protein [Porphyromonas levii]MBR8769627.1 hypothetical protein [Porphyromonas levii]
MSATVTTRKLIDLPDSMIRGLQLRATTLGVSLKKYMEDVLIQKSEEELSDEQLYELMLMIYPDGQVQSTDEEKKDFEAWLAI